MGNKKNHAKKNKRLANNWRNIIKMRKGRPDQKTVPQKVNLGVDGVTRANYEDGNVNGSTDFDSVPENNSLSSSPNSMFKGKKTNSLKPYVKRNSLVLSTTDTASHLQETQNKKNDKQKYYVLQKCDPNQHTRIIRGDFHQGDVRFEELSRGKQYVAISVAALCFFKVNNNPESWKTADINQILINGDIQYHASFKKMQREGQILQALHLSLSEVYPYIKFDRKYYYFNENNADPIHLERNVLQMNNLVTSLNRFFIENQNVTGIFTCNIFSFAIMQKSLSFFLFNSRATSYDGELMDPCDPESAACLMQMFTINCLASYLLLACDQRHMIFYEHAYDPAVSFSITGVNIVKKVFGNDSSKRKKIIRDLRNVESKGRKRKSGPIVNATVNLKRTRFNTESNQIGDEAVKRKSEIISQNKVLIGCGMKNIGNSCFFSACFQAFFHLPIVNNRLQKIKRRECKCLICNIVNVFKDTHNQENPTPYYNPKEIYESLRQLNTDLLDGGQQDAHEFWVLLMNVFENRRNSSTMFDRFFKHDVITNVKCGNCLKDSQTVRETSAHIIEIGGRPTIQEALDVYFAGDVVETYICSACKSINKYEAEKKYFLKSAPNMLCLVLNRFKKTRNKIKDYIELSEQLTLTNFSSSSETIRANYKLVSIINHIGTNISNGHYTATACCFNNTFYEFDDSRVKRLDVISGYNAYIVFYELSAKVEIDTDFDLETDRANESQYNNEELIISENESTPPYLQDEPENCKDAHSQQVKDESVNHEENNTLSGHRIVDIGFLLQQMKYINQHSDSCGSQMIFRKETKLGFRSIFHFECEECGIFHQMQSSSKNYDFMNVNKAATLGITSIGSGFYHMQELCAHMNIPCMSNSTFDNENKKIQKDWSELSKHHTEKALLEEIEHAIAIGNVDSGGNALISVVCDGSWGKRSYGKGFSSLSGCAAIIGLYTKKVVYFGVKNKYCHTCTLSYAKFCPPNEHVCNISYVGPSSGMETEILVEGFKVCESFGARFHKVISDGDSSAFKEITEQCVYQNPDIVIEKIECVNHLYKNARKKFTSLCTDTAFKVGYRRLLKHSIGDDLCKGIRSAAKHWRESKVDIIQKLENLEKDCLNAPYHHFGNHDNCNKYFCQKTTTDGSNAKIILLKSCGIFHEILNYCNIYFASNITSLLEDQTNNAAEELNNVIAKYLGGKRINYSLAGSYTGRVSAAVVQYNSKGHAGSQFHEFNSLNGNSYCLKIENSRKKHYVKNEIARQAKPRKRATKDKTVKGYKAQKEDLSEAALRVAMDIEIDKMNINRIDRDMILASTLGQRLNHRWKEVRKKLINCNYFGPIINARGPTSYQKWLEEMLYSPIEWSNTAEVRHQRLYERDALKMFQLVHKDYELEKTGVFIDEEFGFLGASPLRLFGRSSIVNVQCPVKAYKKTFDYVILKNLAPIMFKDGDIVIKKKSNWYIEIQGQLHITGRNLCYLVVWLGTEFTVTKVSVDHFFWETEMKNKLQFFFNEAMLKELANSRRGRKMDLRNYDPQTNKFV